ncbi:MAG: hypothetical protein ACRDKI_03025 [Solirubrobacterales bacterium]
MKIKLALLSSIAVLGSLALVQPAAAKSSSIKVTTTPAIVNLCRPAADQVRFNFEFSAKIKKRNTSNPRNVVVTYKVLDAATGAQLADGKVTLTAHNHWRKQSPAAFATAGQALTYKLVSVFKAPNTGRKVTAKATLPDQVPTVEQMDQANAQTPAAPPFPACA